MEQITSKTVWTEELIYQVWEEIKKISEEELEIRFPEHLYPFQIEVISADSMINAYASVGMPVMYPHWSFGKDYLRNKYAYDNGHQGLAYELITNDNPCSTLLMEENLMYQQTMVMAHCVGHNSFFKCNEYFKEWTNAGSIIDYLVFAKKYVEQCEQRYGIDAVEAVLDAAHSIAPHGVDKFPRKGVKSLSESAYLKKLVEAEEQRVREEDFIIARTIPDQLTKCKYTPEWMTEDYDPLVGEENLLYYIMKRAPKMANWKREILRIVWKINQYFYVQGQTKISNEGWASFCHYYIMNRLEEKGIISDDAFIAFLKDHSGVIFQPTYEKKYYSGTNPYALGFAIYNDIKRICENPTEEDKKHFPELIGKRWQDAVKDAAFNYRDDSFIMQFMSPKVVRDFQFFTVEIEKRMTGMGKTKSVATVTEIADDRGFKNIRNALAQSSLRVNYVPTISVLGANLEDDRVLHLKYHPWLNRKLHERDTIDVLNYIEDLWGYGVKLED